MWKRRRRVEWERRRDWAESRDWKERLGRSEVGGMVRELGRRWVFERACVTVFWRRDGAGAKKIEREESI